MEGRRLRLVPVVTRGGDCILHYAENSLYYAIKTCIEADHYRVGIATRFRNSVSNEVVDMIDGKIKPYIARVNWTSGAPFIQFKNRSYISVFPIDLDATGYRFDLLIADCEVGNEPEWVRWCEVPDWHYVVNNEQYREE